MVASISHPDCLLNLFDVLMEFALNCRKALRHKVLLSPMALSYLGGHGPTCGPSTNSAFNQGRTKYDCCQHRWKWPAFFLCMVDCVFAYEVLSETNGQGFLWTIFPEKPSLTYFGTNFSLFGNMGVWGFTTLSDGLQLDSIRSFTLPSLVTLQCSNLATMD
eukprot:2624456-Amphidinium_carterae.1